MIQVQNLSSPVIKDSMLYYGSDSGNGKQIAVNIKNGKVIWEYQLDYSSCWPPAIVGNRNYFGDHGGNWIVVENKTGTQLFTTQVNAGICNVASVLDSIVYFSDLTGKLHAFNSKTNKDIWVYDSGSKSFIASH